MADNTVDCNSLSSRIYDNTFGHVLGYCEATAEVAPVADTGYNKYTDRRVTPLNGGNVIKLTGSAKRFADKPGVYFRDGVLLNSKERESARCTDEESAIKIKFDKNSYSEAICEPVEDVVLYQKIDPDYAPQVSAN